uniref:Uncharacterized protein n=1 Tax=Anopheles atroparvus TaxID=41427 RepID=A0AAG5DQR4_ANOAO
RAALPAPPPRNCYCLPTAPETTIRRTFASLNTATRTQHCASDWVEQKSRDSKTKKATPKCDPIGDRNTRQHLGTELTRRRNTERRIVAHCRTLHASRHCFSQPVDLPTTTHRALLSTGFVPS